MRQNERFIDLLHYLAQNDYLNWIVKIQLSSEKIKAIQPEIGFWKILFKYLSTFYLTGHTSPDWNRFVQKTKKVKVVQICKSLTLFISSIYGPSKIIIYRGIIITRWMLWVPKDRWNSCFLQKSLFLLSDSYNKLQGWRQRGT